MNRESGGKSRFPKKVDSPPGSEKLSLVQPVVDCAVIDAKVVRVRNFQERAARNWDTRTEY